MMGLFRRLLLLAVILVVVGGAAIYGVLALSLPVLNGTIASNDLDYEVQIERDDHGIPTVTGKNRKDVAYVTGFLHAQDRFFQMDLNRRNSAGELSELVGTAAFKHDKSVRIHLFRRVAEQVVESLGETERELLQAYTAGVNKGLSELDIYPFEYLILGTRPEPWKPEDSFLTVFSMYLDLNDERADMDSARGFLASIAGREVTEFLSPLMTRWDSGLQKSLFSIPEIPGEESVNLRHYSDRDFEGLAGLIKPHTFVGSNNFAVSGSLSETGSAIVEDDMHLSLRVPTIWYRMQFVYGQEDQQTQVNGITLPGTPFMVVGSNGSVAWAFTNSYGDWNDRINLELTGEGQYLTPEGPLPFQNRISTIHVNGEQPRTVQVLYSLWGPVVKSRYDGSLQALSWTAHNPDATNAGLYKLEQASSVLSAIEIANRTGIPPQNFTVGDSKGSIGWTIAGRIPERSTIDSTYPLSHEEMISYWSGWLNPEDYPRVINPVGGRIWTANARVAGGDDYSKLGNGGYTPGPRAQQIRDELMARNQFSEKDLLDIALDDRALYMSEWRRVALSALDAKAVEDKVGRVVFKTYVEEWSGRAVPEDVGYRLVREFHDAVKLKVLMNLGRYFILSSDIEDGKIDDGWLQDLNSEEASVLRLLEDKPDNWLPPAYGSWNELVLETIDEVIDDLGGAEALPLRTWGERNSSRIHHPLARFIPFLGDWLNMPSVPLAGDLWTPRAQKPSGGVSERMVVSPGHEERGILHLPGGQSGHPLSPFYSTGFTDWVEGRPSAFLPGKTEYKLVMVPGN